ncbi:unnamed protein product, partial [Cylicocyclus nassatus]
LSLIAHYHPPWLSLETWRRSLFIILLRYTTRILLTLMSWQAQTTSNFPPPDCSSSLKSSDVVVVDNMKSKSFQSCLHEKGDEKYKSKLSAKNSSKVIARRLRELCDHFEAEFTIGRMHQSFTVKKGNTVDKVTSWILPKPLFQTWRGSYI